MSSRPVRCLRGVGRASSSGVAGQFGSVLLDQAEELLGGSFPVAMNGRQITSQKTSANQFHWLGIRKDWHPWYPPRDLLSLFVSMPPSDLLTHILVIGRTGSGKTGAIGHCIGQDILLGHSFVILDLRGDLVSIALELCAGRVPPHLVAHFDLREKDPSIGFSPLAGAGPEYVRALAFLAAVEDEHEKLGPQLSETLRNCALLLADCGEPVTRLESILYDDAYRRAQLDRAKNPSVRDFWIRYSDMSKERQSTLAMPVVNKISVLLATPSLRTILGSSNPIDLGKHLDTPGSVTLISLAFDQVSSAGKVFGNLILASICREIFSRVEVPESRRNPVRLYVDECENFDSKHFASILVEGRKYKFSLLLAHQVLAQLSPQMRSIIVNGVGAKLIFATGRSDAELLSKDLTGDAKQLDLTSLRVGEAYLWRRSQELMFLEVNRPLVRDTGSLSKSARAYVEQIRAYRRTTKLSTVTQDLQPLNKEVTPKSAPSKKAARLEDWLQ